MVLIGSCNLVLKRRIHRILGSRVEVIWLRSPELDPVLGEQDWIEQIILDMVLRARIALPHGGRLVIEGANLDLDAICAETEGLTAGRYVMLEMTCLRNRSATRSGGETFPEPFDFSADEWLHSLLPRSREILQSLGGNISEYNEPGRALTLRSFFPSAATVTYSDGENLFVSDLGPETILLVEDESFVRNVAREILETAGYTVLTAETGKEALAVFEKHGPVKLLVTDVVMPGMNGRDLSRKLTAMQPDLKTIYMSGYTDNAAMRHDFTANDVRFIQKPFTLEGLTGKVREILDGSR